MEQATLKVTKEMTVGEVIRKYPSTMEVLQGYGVPTIGCHIPYDETIEGSLKAQDFSEANIQEALDKMNQSVAEWPETVEGIFLTKKAADKIVELASKQSKPGYGIRIKVVPGGCAGFKYGFAFENQTRGPDEIVEQHGVKLYLDTESFSFMKGAKIDFVESIQGAGFKVSNPNTTGSCGCGQSFS
ncbi:iron-sulfur cluster assembly accessory protein [Candidatus Woesearchaeota archaeon]|nr:iron-sulfur cluster assembly accessory protein [Candidatus Woesearchaeota archaeon]